MPKSTPKPKPRGKPAPAPAPNPPDPAPPKSRYPSNDDPRFASVLPFVRGLCELLPNPVPDGDQTYLVAIAVRMSAFDRDTLLAIVRRGCGED